MNNDENFFEEVEDRAVLMSELIEEIIKLEDLLSTHKKYGSRGIQYEQYITRKKEYTDKLRNAYKIK